ncbi:MAG: diguanylate cyclase [Myxococcales bacterium]|nr:diguanylate cyclase [Myxococcales bacterium]MDP3504565.1 diguanylate cyclase [Myxococcales bacterium]
MPQARRKTLEVARREEGALKLEGRLLLLVDDDRGVIELLRRGLAPFGYRFVEAEDGTQALTAIRKHQPDLILMDVEMPGLGGVEVCRIVKANQGAGFAFTPVILMTAGRSSGKVEGLELGADDYLVKPFDMLEVSARVKSMLRLKALQDTLVEKNKELDRINRELEEKRSALELLSRTDGLTQLINRRHFEELLQSEWQRSLRYRAPLSCMLLDIDHFKKVNDTWGHPFGDTVLREVAGVARRALRDVDVLARYGGEELIALLPETSPEEAWRAAERVRMGVEAMRLTCRTVNPPEQVRCTASIGVSTAPGPGIETPEQLVQLADECLYEAKQGGRNQVRQALTE